MSRFIASVDQALSPSLANMERPQQFLELEQLLDTVSNKLPSGSSRAWISSRSEVPVPQNCVCVRTLEETSCKSRL